MRIGIDVSSLCSKWDGIGTFVMDMVNYISKQQSDDIFYLYSNLKTALQLPVNKSMVIRADNCTNHFKWLVTRLPKQMKEDCLDVFWQPNYLMPVKIKGIKNIVTVHDVSAYAYTQYSTFKITLLHKLFLKSTCRKADTIFAISNNGGEEIKKFFPDFRNKVKKIYIGKKMFENGLNASPAECDNYLRRLDILKNEYLLFVGTLSPRKNAKVIIEGYFKYCEDGGAKKLVLAGNISSRCENLKKIIAESRYSKNVVIAGYISDLQKRILYYHAAMLLFPSRLEGFGFPILEGMQAGIPVITSKCSCMPEIAGDAAAYLNDIDSSKELANRIFEVEHMTAYDRIKLIQRGFERVQYFEKLNYPKKILQEITKKE